MPPTDKGLVARAREAVMNLPDPDAAEFAPIRADLARLFLEHKAELGLGGWTDDQIVAKVSDITAALFGCGQVALQRGDTEWLDRHRWFSDACTRLFVDQPAVPLDG
jgi:hypothetical protein